MPYEIRYKHLLHIEEKEEKNKTPLLITNTKYSVHSLPLDVTCTQASGGNQKLTSSQGSRRAVGTGLGSPERLCPNLRNLVFLIFSLKHGQTCTV